MGKENIMIDNRGETQSKPVNFINKKVSALVVAGSMFLGGAGCAEARTVDTSNNIPTSVKDTTGTSETTKLVTPKVTVTPESTSKPTITEHTEEATDPKVTVKPATTVGTSAETQYVTQAPTETTIPTTVETTMSAEDLALLTEAGTLDGAETSIKVDANGNRVAIYVAKEGNIYGVDVGTELGQYCENVKYEGEDLKFRALIPTVVEKLLSDDLAKIPEGQPKLKIIFPGNIIQANGNEINMTNLKDYFGNDTIQVSCTSSIDVVNIIPNSDAFSLSWFDWNNWTYAMPTYVGDQVKDLSNKTNNEIMYFLKVMIPETPKLNKETEGLNTKFGLVIGNSGGKDLFVGCSDSKGSYPVKISDFAKAEDDGYYISIIPEETTETN